MELEYFADHLSEISEDGLDFSDTDSLNDPEYIPESDEEGTDIPLIENNDGTENNTIREQDQEVTDYIENNNAEPSAQNHQVRSKPTNSKVNKVNIIWKKKNLVLSDVQKKFRGSESLSNTLLELDTPYECFSYFFTEDLYDKITEESCLYAQQIEIDKPLYLTKAELKKYFGIIIYMSNIRLPNTRSYWNHDVGLEIISQTMTVNRFEKIRQFLHFNNNELHLPRDHENHDRLHKLRPLIDHLNNKFSSVALEAKLSIDEQLCSTKLRHFMKQYLPMKPHKWGFKLFVLCGISGFAYFFEVYSGQENSEIRRLITEPDLGACANIVVRLARIIPKNLSYQLFFDNYYTTLDVLVYLAENGILSMGTVRRNRVPNCKLPTEKDLKKEMRGTSYEFVANYKNIDISSIVWKDNKVVNLLSTFGGQLPITAVKRYDKVSKASKDIPCPYIIHEYNKHMGGVDLLDANIARHKILTKSKKWYIRIFYHLLDLTLANAWLLYRRIGKTKGNSYMEKLTFFDFRMEVAKCLCKVGQSNNIKRGRPSSGTIEEMVAAKKTKGPTRYVPPRDIRLDQVGHWMVWATRNRCKFPGCSGYSQTSCEKCGLNLCFNKKNNCFKKFHTQA